MVKAFTGGAWPKSLERYREIEIKKQKTIQWLLWALLRHWRRTIQILWVIAFITNQLPVAHKIQADIAVADPGCYHGPAFRVKGNGVQIINGVVVYGGLVAPGGHAMIISLVPGGIFGMDELGPWPLG